MLQEFPVQNKKATRNTGILDWESRLVESLLQGGFQIDPELERHHDCSKPSVKFEQFPLPYPRSCAAPLQGIAPIATLERFVIYCSCEQIISAAPPGAAQRARGIAQAVTLNYQCLLSQKRRRGKGFLSGYRGQYHGTVTVTVPH